MGQDANHLSSEWIKAVTVDLFSHDAAYHELLGDGRIRISEVRAYHPCV